MTTTSRIRWERNEDDNSLTGRTGTMTEPVFWIWPPEAPGKAHILTSSLPGHDKDFYPNGFVSDVKAKAEEWLAEHVASLGAVFPDEPGESAALQLSEARDVLARWDAEQDGEPVISREKVLADQVRALLAIVDRTTAATAGERRSGDER